MEMNYASAAADGDTPVVPVPQRPLLPAKGACWYCEKRLDSVRRFCCRACADAFAEEAALMR